MKRALALFLGALFFLVLSNNNVLAFESITQEQKEILINEVGLSEEDLDILPEDHLLMLIDEGAEVVSSNSEIIEFLEVREPGDMTTFGTIKTSKLKLTGKTIKLSNNSKGQKRYQLYGTFKWLSNPINAYTDAMSIGYESGKGITLPTSGGKVMEHSHEYATYERGIKNRREYSTTPDDYSPGNGVGAKYNIRQGGVSHQGYISQNVYMTKSTGTSNLKFEYGHQKTVFSPSFSISKGVFGISPGIGTDTQYFADTLEW